MKTVNIEEIRESNRLKKEKCEEAKAAMRDILSDEQLEKFDGVFDRVVGKVFRGVVLRQRD